MSAQPAQASSASSAGANPAQPVFQLALGIFAATTLHAVTKLGIFDLLKDEPRSAEDLAKSAGANADALYRAMRALASSGLFVESPKRTFALTESGNLLRSDEPGSLRAMALWMGCKMHLDTYNEVIHALRTGETVVEKVYGVSCFEYFEKDKETSDVFNDAMTSFSAVTAPAVLEAYDFNWLSGKTLVDVAGGHGMILCEILKKNPAATGVLFDLEHVVKGARPRLEAEKLADRCTLAHGDFFQEVPSGDAYVMKHIIHDWDDAKATTILKNIHRASKPNAKVLLIEIVLTDGPESNMAKWIDLEMLMLPGGRERTEEEYRALLAGAGFRLTRIVPTKSPFSVIEAVKEN